MSTEVWFDASWDVRMTDTSLRDGSHHKRHQFTKDEVGAIVAALERQTEIPSSIPVPWPLMKLAATTISAVNNRFLDGRAKFPGIVVPEKLDGRFKPFRYNNDRARRLLGWAPQYTLAQAFTRSLSDTDLVVERAGSA